MKNGIKIRNIIKDITPAIKFYLKYIYEPHFKV